MRAHRSDPLLAPPLDPELLGSHSGIAGLAGSLWTCWSVLARALSGWAEGVKTVGRVWESGLAAERFQAQSGTHTFRCGAHLQVRLWGRTLAGAARTFRRDLVYTHIPVWRRRRLRERAVPGTAFRRPRAADYRTLAGVASPSRSARPHTCRCGARTSVGMRARCVLQPAGLGVVRYQDPPTSVNCAFRLDTVLWAAGALPLTAFAAAAGIGSSLDTLRQGARALVWRRSSLPWVDCGRRWR
mmetsp:Transcript_41403/g.100506  ORF Transcript_41403/g.100506 Transcript_41403/m.100506 type:complete len:242 (-) Transcript_41403:2875-3600(-)